MGRWADGSMGDGWVERWVDVAFTAEGYMLGAAAMSTLELKVEELGGCPRWVAGHSKGQMGWSTMLLKIYSKFLAGDGGPD